MSVSDRQAREFQRREKEILAAARVLFSEASWESITIAQIAERAEVGKGTVYKHFASKDEIFGRIFLEHEQQLHRHLTRTLPESLGPVAGLRRTAALMWAHHVEDWEYHRRMVQYAERPGVLESWGAELGRALGEVQQSILALYRQPIERGIAEGVFQDQGVEAMLFFAGAALQGALRQALSMHAPPVLRETSTLEALLDFILRSFGCPASRLRETE